MGALDAVLLPLFLVFAILPYVVYWLLRRLTPEEEREKLKKWG